MPPRNRRTPEERARAIAEARAARGRETAARTQRAKFEEKRVEISGSINALLSKAKKEADALEKRIAELRKNPRRIKRTAEKVSNWFAWVKNVLFRGEKKKFSDIRKLRHPKLRELEEKRSQALLLQQRAESFQAAFERNPTHWIQEIERDGLMKVFDKHFH